MSKSSSSKTYSSSSSSSSSGVTCIWDFENSWIPDDYILGNLKANIEAALKKQNSNFFIQGKVIAIGPAGGVKYQAIRSLSAEFKFSTIPEENLRCDTQDCDTLVVNCRSDNREKIMRKTDVADKYAIKKMFMKALDKKRNILIISGDIDFVNSIVGLKEEDTFIMLAVNKKSSRGMFGRAKVTWYWSSEDPDIPTMVKGGAPIPHNRRF